MKSVPIFITLLILYIYIKGVTKLPVVEHQLQVTSTPISYYRAPSSCYLKVTHK